MNEPLPDHFDPSHMPEKMLEKRSYLTALPTAAKFAALVGVPAAAGALTTQLMGGDKVGGSAVSLLGGSTVGAVVGGAGGFALTPGKNQGGILLCFLTVPAGMAAGAIAWPILSTIGAAGGWTGVAVGAGIAAGLGAGAEAYFVHKDNQRIENHNKLFAEYQIAHPKA